MFKKNLSLIATYIFLIFCSSIFNVSANNEYISRSDLTLTSFDNFKDSVDINIFKKFEINKVADNEFVSPSEVINSLFIDNFNLVSDAKTLNPDSLVSTYQQLLDTNPKYIFQIFQAAKSRAYELEGSLAFNLITEIEFILVEQLGKINGIQIAPDTISKKTLVQLNSVYQKISTDLKQDAEVATNKFNEFTGKNISTKQFSLVTGGLAAIGLYYLLDEDDGCSDPAVNLSISATTVAEASGTATITATITDNAAQNITIPLTVSGSATSGTDYQAISSITI